MGSINTFKFNGPNVTELEFLSALKDVISALNFLLKIARHQHNFRPYVGGLKYIKVLLNTLMETMAIDAIENKIKVFEDER